MRHPAPDRPIPKSLRAPIFPSASMPAFAAASSSPIPARAHRVRRAHEAVGSGGDLRTRARICQNPKLSHFPKMPKSPKPISAPKPNPQTQSPTHTTKPNPRQSQAFSPHSAQTSHKHRSTTCRINVANRPEHRGTQPNAHAKPQTYLLRYAAPVASNTADMSLNRRSNPTHHAALVTWSPKLTPTAPHVPDLPVTGHWSAITGSAQTWAHAQHTPPTHKPNPKFPEIPQTTSQDAKPTNSKISAVLIRHRPIKPAKPAYLPVPNHQHHTSPNAPYTTHITQGTNKPARSLPIA